jgi:Flp pilus assembly protein TadG
MIGRSLFSVLKDRRGAVAIVMALALPVVVGMAGLGVEAGKWFLVKRQAQTAADAAAFAGALELAANSSSTVTSVRSAARKESERNGFAHGSNPKVDVTIPYTYTDPYTHKVSSNAVEVIVTRDETRLFSAIYLSTPARIVARAVGLVNASGAACILATNPLAHKALEVTGSAVLNMENCSLGSNSTASDSMSFWGKSAVQASSAWAAGGIVSGGSSLPSFPGGTASYAWTIPDPYVDLDFTIPAIPSSLKCKPSNSNTSVPINLSTGVYLYCGDVKISENTELEPGTYYIDEGDFEVGSGVSLTCKCSLAEYGVNSGVTIVLTSSNISPKKIGSVKINGNAKVTLQAPKACPASIGGCSAPKYPGMLFIQDRRAETKMTGSEKSVNQNIFNGGADLSLTGLLYFPSQSVTWSGNSDTNSCTQIIANTVSFTGNTNLSNTGCAEMGVKPITIKYASLVE